MNLGLGIMAGNSFYNQEQANKDLALKNAQSASTMQELPSQTAADISNNQNTLGLNKSRAAIRPGATANVIAQQGLDAANTAGDIAAAPAINAAKSVNSQIGLGDATNKLKDQPIEQTIGNIGLSGQLMTAQSNQSLLPGQLGMAANEQQAKEESERQQALGMLANKLSTNDRFGALQYMQSIADNNGVMSGTNGHHYSNIEQVNPGADPNMPNGGYAVQGTDAAGKPLGGLDANGKPVGLRIPAEALQRAQYMLLPHKFETGATRQGTIYTTDQATGKVNVVKGDADLSAGTQKKPAEQMMAEWIMAHKDDPVAMAALDRTHSLKGGEKEWTQALMSRDPVMMTGDTQKIMERADFYKKAFTDLGFKKFGESTAAPGQPAPAQRATDQAVKDALGL